MAFMDTDLTVCLERVQARRDRRGNAREFDPHNTQNRFEGIRKVRQRVEAEGKMRVCSLPGATATDVIEEMLQ